jgi:4-hydroxybenzoate polyprenyltransferase
MARGFDPVAYLKLFRFPLVFTAIADSAAGYVIATPTMIQPLAMILLAVCSAGLYFFGMALNDIVDLERDKVIASNRVLPSGRLTVKSAKIAAGIALGCSLAAILGILDTPAGFLQRIVVWALVVLCITAYNVFLKIPLTMGFVRAFNLLLGVAAGRLITFDIAGQPWQYAILALPALVYVSSLTYVSTLEDASPSRRKVMVGAALMSAGALLAALAGPVLQIVVYFAPFWEAASKFPWAFLFSIILIGWTVRRAAHADDEKSIMLLVRDGVGGIILLDAALLASCEDVVSALMVASLLVPAALSVAVFKRLA